MSENCQGKYVHSVSINTSLVNAMKQELDRYLHVFLLLARIYHTFGVDSASGVYIIIVTHMNEKLDSKHQALKANGSLHPHPENVQDERFLHDSFFDPNDVVQVKYEMLRRQREGDTSVSDVAKSFGTSRQAFYAARHRFQSQGIPGLVPKRRGPHAAHKCTEEVLEFAEQWKHEHQTEPSHRLADAIEQHFGIRVHPRTITRALDRRKKNGTARRRHPNELHRGRRRLCPRAVRASAR